MSFAYGMRFDDDSNAITVIDEENQTSNTTGYINGEYIEFDSNPNTVQTVNATMADPWGDISPSDLASAISSGDASASIFMHTQQMFGSDITLYMYADNNYIYGVYCNVIPENQYAYRAEWRISNGNLTVLNAYINGNYTDGRAYASAIQTDLTVIWHPLPEE